MGERDGMTADEWERARMYPNDIDKQPQTVAQRQPGANDLLHAILREQRETNRLLGKIGKLLLTEVMKRQTQPMSAPTPQNGNAPPANVDLDSERGNFRVNKDPPKWQGDSFAGRLLSECSPEFLDELAKFYEWQIWKAESTLRTTPDDKKAKDTIKYKPLDIARAKGWASRLRNGWGQSTSGDAGANDTSTGGESDTPTDDVPILG